MGPASTVACKCQLEWVPVALLCSTTPRSHACRISRCQPQHSLYKHLERHTSTCMCVVTGGPAHTTLHKACDAKHSAHVLLLLPCWSVMCTHAGTFGRLTSDMSCPWVSMSCPWVSTSVHTAVNPIIIQQTCSSVFREHPAKSMQQLNKVTGRGPDRLGHHNTRLARKHGSSSLFHAARRPPKHVQARHSCACPSVSALPYCLHMPLPPPSPPTLPPPPQALPS
jgi:hypothetical protein